MTGRRGVTLPFTDYCEVLHVDKVPVHELEDHLLHVGSTRGWKSLALHGAIHLFNDAPTSLSFYRHVLDLKAGPEKLLSNLKGTTRSQVRQATEKGVSVRIDSSRELLECYYALHCATRKKHGLPPQPVSFFRSIQRNCMESGKGFVTLAYHEGSPIAGAVFLQFNKRAHYKYSASLESKLPLRGNNLVMWESIRRLSENGFETLDFGRTSVTNAGLRKYKLGWGTREETLQYRRYDFRERRFVGERDDAEGLHNALFRKLPMPFLQWCGNALYRHLA
jgi:hypothetical protein